MKVRIVRPVPVEAKHGIRVGEMYEVVEEPGDVGRGLPGVVIMGGAGEVVLLRPHEYELVGQPQ